MTAPMQTNSTFMLSEEMEILMASARKLLRVAGAVRTGGGDRRA